MELLTPSHPPSPNEDRFSGFSPPPVNLRHGFERISTPVTSKLPEIFEESGDKVFVAVGKNLQKSVALLKWSSRRFANRELCILHVHKPSPLIPTLLGKLPASQANGEVVSAYRREENDQMKKLLLNYLSLCSRLKVKASIITTEGNVVAKGIVDLANIHGIRKLVMGAVPENWMKVKKGSNKASYFAKNAPLFCEIWFVNKGTLVWSRKSSENPFYAQTVNQSESSAASILKSRSLHYNKIENTSDPTSTESASARFYDGDTTHFQTEVPRPVALTSTYSRSTEKCDPLCLHSLSTSSSGSPGSEQFLNSEIRTDEESLCSQIEEVEIEAETSRNLAFAELLKCKKLEAEAVEAISKVKAFESAHAHEVELRKEAQDALRNTIQEQKKLLEEREEIMRQLQKAMRNISLLNSRAQEADRRGEEAAEELKLVQTSVATLWHEKQKLLRQKMEAACWIERWRHRGEASSAYHNDFVEFNEDNRKLADFSLSDLQTATCDFSVSFKIGQGGYGSVYKGEMLGRTVAIKKLHPHNLQGQLEFQQEVQSLGKLEHPHLVTLIGICLEACALVYEYLPNGNLQDRLFQKSTVSSLNWKIRARIIAQVADALLFLHSSRHEKIVHGGLKLENILLDSKFSCKISDYGVCWLVPEGMLRCPSFRQYAEPMSAFPYTDPEFCRTGILTPSSDIYSFGLIILQLVTGRAPAGLIIEMRKAVSYGRLASILDSSAGEWPSFVTRRLMDLGLQCCELNSRDRPKLTASLVKELEQLHVLEERAVPSLFLCPILREIMHDPQVAADGFTYEGDALRGWLENGRETSPMTNLKLSHSHLTPNHALRSAIQDWLCSS